jgi:hypothetical protein
MKKLRKSPSVTDFNHVFYTAELRNVFQKK